MRAASSNRRHLSKALLFNFTRFNIRQRVTSFKFGDFATLSVGVLYQGVDMGAVDSNEIRK
jgi:hypothetical protein